MLRLASACNDAVKVFNKMQLAYLSGKHNHRQTFITLTHCPCPINFIYIINMHITLLKCCNAVVTLVKFHSQTMTSASRLPVLQWCMKHGWQRSLSNQAAFFGQHGESVWPTREIFCPHVKFLIGWIPTEMTGLHQWKFSEWRKMWPDCSSQKENIVLIYLTICCSNPVCFLQLNKNVNQTFSHWLQ